MYSICNTIHTSSDHTVIATLTCLSAASHCMFFFKYNIFLKLSFWRERKGETETGRERERESINFSFHVSVHSLVVSYMCPDLRSTCTPGASGLQATRLACQGINIFNAHHRSHVNVFLVIGCLKLIL